MDKIKKNSEPTGQNGYPEKDVNRNVTHSTMRGAGAATKGTKFVSEMNLKHTGKLRRGWSY